MKTRNMRLLGLVITAGVLALLIIAAGHGAKTPTRATRLHSLNRVTEVAIIFSRTNIFSKNQQNQTR